MELCIGTTTSSMNFVANLNPSRTTTNPLLRFKSHVSTSSLRPSFPRRQSLVLDKTTPFHRKHCRFVALASRSFSSPSSSSSSSSSVVAEEKKDKLPANLGVTVTEQPNSRLKLTVEVPPAVCDDCYQRVLNEFTKQSKIPGFRAGKRVPENIVLHYAGKENIQKATVESVLKRTLPHAVSSVTDKALKESMYIATQFSDLEHSYVSKNTISYDIILDVAPEIKWNPEEGYKNMKIVVEIDSDIDAQKVCEKELRYRRKALGVMRIVTDRGLEIGDVAVLDVSATTIAEDESNVRNIPSAESKGFHFDTEEGDRVLPGFVEALVGIKPGVTKSFPLFFSETWRQESLRGVHAQFTVDCKELFYRDLPELDDSLADKLISGCTTLEQVKELLLQRCKEAEKNAKDQATDNAILDQLSKMIEADIPQSLFEEQGRSLYGSKLLEIQSSVKLTDEQLATLSSQKALNEFLNHQRDNITRLIKQNLSVGDIFKRENLEFSTDELLKEVQNSIAEFKEQKQEYDEERVKEQVQEILEGAKVLEWLREHSEIQYITRES